jgi:hypothetical protein
MKKLFLAIFIYSFLISIVSMVGIALRFVLENILAYSIALINPICLGLQIQ